MRLPSEMANDDLQHSKVFLRKLVHEMMDVADAKHLLLNWKNTLNKGSELRLRPNKCYLREVGWLKIDSGS